MTAGQWVLQIGDHEPETFDYSAEDHAADIDLMNAGKGPAKFIQIRGEALDRFNTLNDARVALGVSLMFSWAE